VGGNNSNVPNLHRQLRGNECKVGRCLRGLLIVVKGVAGLLINI